ncbi:MAG: hypothetical protein H6607_07605 [Flavobacteriales bacterium]|nr:hypothetical protein [Flavobacteriales bacterium]
MKKLIFLSILGSLVWGGCANFDARTQFIATFVNRFVLDSTNTSISTDLEAFSDTLITDFEGLIEDHSSSYNKLESSTMESLALEIDGLKSASTANFDFLKNFEIYIKGKDMDEFLLGGADSVPLGARYFEFRPEDAAKDYTDLLKGNEFTCRMTYQTNSRILTDSAVVVKVVPKYRMDTKKFGI